MNLLVIGMNYAPERTGIGPYTTELCEYLAGKGHRVTVATTFPHYPEWETYAPYRGKFFQREERNGVVLLRRAVWLPQGPSAVRRILYDTSLGVGAVWSALRGVKFDLALAIAPPIQAGVAARLLARQLHVPYVLLVKDLALEAARSVGMMRASAALRWAHEMERWSYARAARIIVISHGFLQNLTDKGVAPDKLVLLPDWADSNIYHNADEGNGFRHAQGIDERSIVVLHSGNMGAKQQLENVLNAAARLKGEPEISFVLIGDGSQKAALVEKARREHLDNVQFLPLQPRDELPHMLAAADILLLNQHPELVEAAIPSKLLAYMAAARPVVIAAHRDSEAARQVQQAQCGVWVAPNQPAELARAIVSLAADAPGRRELGAHGRAFVERNFARTQLLQAYETCLLSAARQGEGR